METKKIEETKIVFPHEKVSAPCTEKDIENIYTDSADMLLMCVERKGFMAGAYAIAHPQINDDNPLRFFVTKKGRIICNPKIINHTKTPIDSEEYCMTFFYKKDPAIVQRWNVIDVEYDELKGDKFEHTKSRLNGLEARVWQHEIDHLDAKYIYEVDFDKIMKEKEAQEKIDKIKKEAEKIEVPKEDEIIQSIDILK